MARPRKRPHPADEGILDRICDELIAGRSMLAICKSADMPAACDVYRHIAKDVEFATAIARAREAQQDALIDETIDMADKATAKNWQAVRLKIWARQWRAAKLRPKVYGEKLDVKMDGETKVTVASDEALTQIIRDGFAELAKLEGKSPEDIAKDVSVP